MAKRYSEAEAAKLRGRSGNTASSPDGKPPLAATRPWRSDKQWISALAAGMAKLVAAGFAERDERIVELQARVDGLESDAQKKNIGQIQHPNGKTIIARADGGVEERGYKSSQIFHKDGRQEVRGEDGRVRTVSRDGEERRFPDGTVEQFDTKGRLVRRRDAHGHVETFGSVS